MNREFGVWASSAPQLHSLPRLDDSLETDVVIIGAGYTGLSTALHLAEKGIEPVVLEAKEPGWGGSGRNTGWMEPNWWLKQPADIKTQFGDELGSELTRWVASGPRLLRSWISKYQLEFEFEQRGLIMASDSTSKAQSLEKEVAEWQSLGVDNEYLDKSAISKHFASNRYLGAIFLRDGATLNPLALSRELARANIEQGVSIFAQTPALTIDRTDNDWFVTTPKGLIKAAKLIIATDSYTDKLWPGLRQSYSIWHAAVVASKPYESLSRLLLSGIPFADLNIANFFTLRGTRDSRLVTSTFRPLRSQLSARDVAEPFMRKFRKTLPRQAEPEWEYVHYGEIGLSRDMLPRVCAIGPGAWTAYGYSGTGINFALLLGGQLAQLARGETNTLFPITELASVSNRHILEWGLRYIHAPLARHVLSRFT